jgi:dTDP-4-amino-4,6-dideoxygalactose transaminase
MPNCEYQGYLLSMVAKFRGQVTRSFNMSDHKIPFNRPYMTGKELYYIEEARVGGMLAGNGPFTKRCQNWIEQRVGCEKALLTHSCTSALEMAFLLLDIQPGDEVIVPSYTFVSTASAFVLRGGVPVFVDIREDTLNLDERLIEAAITPRTKAIVPVHYSGIACEMDTILDVARRHGLKVVEDAAQGVMALYKGRALGSIGDLGTFSFHETKNLISGEGGALLVNDPALVIRAQIIWANGTDRHRFFRGEVDKYTWQEVGSSFFSSELTAAFLLAQLEEAESITQNRLDSWNRYHSALEPIEAKGLLRRPIVPSDCQHNAHMYYVLLAPGIDRRAVILKLNQEGINAVFHYVPLHSSLAGQRYGRIHGAMTVTDMQSERLVRLPLWFGLTEAQQEKIVDALARVVS